MSEEIKLQHDDLFDIALGQNRNTRNWKNKELLWSAFVQRISKTHYTAEDYAEYMAAKKSRQDEIKDVGGYVGGYLTKGRRLNGHVVHRQIVTLDIDFATTGIWEDFLFMYDNAAAIYSTHKHNIADPRYRLVIPLDRPVLADEYQAICRRIAERLGINNFDHTTFQPTRLMYWPSTSADGVFEFNYQDGAWMSADALLATYFDWHDTSEWPMCAREDKFIQYGIKKQGDPLEKNGIVGAYCRTHSITDVLEGILSDVYESTDVEGRYSYREGSTAGGLVTYEDKFAYSHHGTDPISGKLCNAFDLVRLHKFGIKDDDIKEGTPGNRFPSYIAMLDYCTKDVDVRKQLGTERLADAKHDFDIDVPETDLEADENDDWVGELDIDTKGNYRSTIDNVISVLKHDPAVKLKMALNTFEQREVALYNLPWRKVTAETQYLTDGDDAGVRHYMEKMYGIAGVQKTTDALNLAVIANSFHPVRDYLTGLVWDKQARIDYLLIDYLGAEDSGYTKAVTRKTLAAAVARIFEPGVKFDTVLTLVGPQGTGKSTLIKKLGRAWFSDSFTTVQGKEAFEQIQGVWIVELAELAGLKKAEVDAIKHYVAKQEDRYRVAYGRRTENFPRQCIFIGTTNNKDFLRDPTGNRRWWPVDTSMFDNVKSVWEDLTAYEINQVWAEAVHLYQAGELLHLDEGMELQAFEKQAEHSERDERAGMIQTYLDILLPEDWQGRDLQRRRAFISSLDDELQESGTVVRNRVCVAEIWCEILGRYHSDMTPFNTKDLHNIMRTMPGWYEGTTKTDFPLYGTQRVYRRTDENMVQKRLAEIRAEFRNN